MRPNDGRVVPTFVTQALRNEDLTIYGDGEQTRSFCYVDDLIEGLVSLMRVENPEHDVYNIGKENERTVKELAQEVLNLTNTESDIVYEPLPEDDPSRRKPDITRAKNDLGWTANVSLETGLTETIRHFEKELET